MVCDRDAKYIEWEPVGNGVLAKTKRRLQAGFVRSFNFDWPTNDTVTTRLRDVLESNVDEKYYLSEEKTAELVAQLEAKNPDERMSRQAVETFNDSKHAKEHGDMIHAFNRRHDKRGICPTLTTRPEGFKTAALPIVRELQDSDNCVMVGNVDIRGNESIRRVYSAEGIAPTLTTMGGGHREPKIAELQQYTDGSGVSHAIDANYAKGTSPGDVGKGRRTHVLESEVPSWIPKPDDINRTLRSGGKATLSVKHNYDHIAEEVLVRPVLTPDRAEKRQNGRRFKEDGEESFTLTGQDRHGVAIGFYPRYRIRKLTPLECWRLQGFLDEVFFKAKGAGVSASQLYKQAGNTVTIHKIFAVGEKLLPLMESGGLNENDS